MGEGVRIGHWIRTCPMWWAASQIASPGRRLLQNSRSDGARIEAQRWSAYLLRLKVDRGPRRRRGGKRMRAARSTPWQSARTCRTTASSATAGAWTSTPVFAHLRRWVALKRAVEYAAGLRRDG